MNFQRFIGIFRKFLEKGPVWALSRTRKEFKHPTFPFMKRLVVSLKTVEQKLASFFNKNKMSGEDPITAVYDLNVNPITFDFASFLIGAEIFSNKNGRNSFVLVIVCRNDDAEVDGKYSSVVDEDGMKWRLENIIFPLINLCPACIGYSVLPNSSNISETIKDKLVFPEFYDGKYIPGNDLKKVYEGKNKFNGLSASIQGLRHINRWKESNNIVDKIITITLRQYSYDPTRNSDINEWVEFSKLVKKEGYIPVFIPDTDACFQRDPRLDGFIVFKDPCWNLGLRMALYEEAYLNFFVPNGPADLAQLNKKVKSICMKFVVPGSLESTYDVYKERGLKIGQRKYDFGEDYQVLSWEMDNFENISKEFYQFLATHSEFSEISS
jgi:hypothetical protein